MYINYLIFFELNRKMLIRIAYLVSINFQIEI